MFVSIPNLSSRAVTPFNPLKFKNEMYGKFKDKTEFFRTCMATDTQHHFYSLSQGEQRGLRVSEMNPVVIIDGIIADYDQFITPEMIKSVKEHQSLPLPPNYCHVTFSKGVRLIWTFETSLTVGPEIIPAFLKTVMSTLKPQKLLPGFDLPAFKNLYQYYEAGVNWEVINPTAIPQHQVHKWLYDAGNSLKWNVGETFIPFEELEKETEKRFPGKWKGQFAEGARGVRFWDPTASNDTAAILRKNGVQCFSGPFSFVTWSMIFGKDFVQQFKSKQIGNAIAGIYFDGAKYWWEDEGMKWLNWTKQSLLLRLQSRFDLSSRIEKGETMSELNRVVSTIESSNRVKAATVVVHNTSGIYYEDHMKMLNINNRHCMDPAPGITGLKWGENFKWIANFLDNFFQPPEQLDYFLSWLKWFYENGYKRKPRKGQVLFFAGDTNQGKTLLADVIISKMVGGHYDSSGFLQGETRFSGTPFSYPLMTINDTAPLSDPKRHLMYSALIKKLAANHFFSSEQKYEAEVLVRWHGRLIVTCNTDPESIRLLPNMEVSILDKISLFNVKTLNRKFPLEIEDIISEELPYFCRWLLEYPIPKHCDGDSRFGIKHYVENELYQTASQAGQSYAFLEALSLFFVSYEANNEGSRKWAGTASKLLSDMLKEEAVQPLVHNFNAFMVGSLLGQLKAKGYSLSLRRAASMREWTIEWGPDGLTKTPESSGSLKPSDELDLKVG